MGFAFFKSCKIFYPEERVVLCVVKRLREGSFSLFPVLSFFDLSLFVYARFLNKWARKVFRLCVV